MYDGMPQSVGDVTAHRRPALGRMGRALDRTAAQPQGPGWLCGARTIVGIALADVDRLSDRRFVVMGRQEPGRLGKFYPPDVTSPEARLRYYASQFPLVEVDSSYYATPLPVTTQQWAERTPDEFVFNDKSSKSDLLRSIPS